MPPQGNAQKKDTTANSIRNSISTAAIILGWFFTIIGLVWTASAKDTQYEYRITNIEKELINLDERLDAAETFRMEIRSDLAEIKTDLLWIRRELETK